MKVVFSPRALDRILEIESFLSENASPAKAEQVVGQLKSRVRGLASMPRMGRMVPEVGDPDLRELIVAPYRVIYGVRDDLGVVEIHTVIHGRQQLPLEELRDD